MRYLLVLILLIISTSGFSYSLLNLEELTMTHARLGEASRIPQAPQYTGYWLYRTSLNMRFNFLGPLYWDNKVHMEATQASPKTVGWWWMLGLRVHPQIDIFYEHHSQHIMDTESPSAQLYKEQRSRNFPVEDSYGIKFNIYEGAKGWSIFD